MDRTERSASRERSAVVKHVQNAADGSRAGIPMWDSSDPERAPPPLPLNPGTQSPTKPNTSSAIAAAAQQIIERARESTPLSSYTSNATPSASPERSLIKGAHHKRMQSLQTGSVKDLRSYIDNNRSPERSPERSASRDSFSLHGSEKNRDLSPVDRSSTPTPMSKDMLKDAPSLRPVSRPPPRPLLGENTPPSSTMLALQTMKVPDDIIDSIGMRPSTPTTPRVNTTYDFSSQLLNLTTIATNLQHEMAAISRRSKDNATDLLSLKEATLKRDEDIRKSLRDLSTNVSAKNLLGAAPASNSSSRSGGSYGGLFLDSKAFNSPPSATKSWTMPRVSSVPNLAEEARLSSPSPYSVEGAASVAMLEKIIREMVTKEGQERLLTTLNELFEKSSKNNAEAAKKVEELAGFIKQRSVASSLVPVSQSSSGAPQLDLSFDSPRDLARTKRAATDSPQASHSDEVFKLLQRIKDSVSHAGGTTAEVKGLVRDMRGEVLGMGRELAKKLDQVSEAQLSTTLDRSIEDSQGTQSASEVRRVVQEGLEEIRSHIASALHENSMRIASDTREVSPPSSLDSDQVYAVVKHALAEHGEINLQSRHQTTPSFDHEGVLEAVKEGLKDFEPNIELQQFGLERDEILAVLKEGLNDYQRNRPEPAPLGIDKGELYEMMQEALKDCVPGSTVNNTDHMREEILADVRLALAAFQASAETPHIDNDMIRLAVADAVKEGLVEHGPAAPRELEISRDDLFDAVKASLDGTTIPFNSFGEQVLQQLHELIEGMRTEFKQYSAANGRDTEQVLDAVKDGLESLRAEIENYVDRAQDVTGKDEIVDTVKSGLEQLRGEVQGYCLQNINNDNGNGELLDYIKAEFEHLHEAVGSSRGMQDPATDRSIDLLHALQSSVDNLRHGKARSMISEDEPETREEVFEAMKLEFEQLKSAILHGHAVDKSDLIETIQDSLGSLHARLTGSDVSSLSTNSAEELLRDIRHEFAEVKGSLAANMDEGDREVIIGQVKTSIDDLRVQLAADQNDAAAESLGMIKEELERFRESMVGMDGTRSLVDSDTSVSAIREGIEDIRERLAGQAASGVSNELLESFRGEFENLRTMVNNQPGSHEEIVDIIRVGLDDLRSGLEKKIDSPERRDSQQAELLDVMSEGLDTLRADVLKTLDKPLDMTVNYEILDTLKDGLISLRAELDAIKPVTSKPGQIVLADGAIVEEGNRDLSQDVPPAASAIPRQPGLDHIEVLLTQLQIKIEGLASTMHDSAHQGVGTEGAATKQDLEHIEVSLKDLQETVLAIAERESPATAAPDGTATKVDTDAIETLVRNTKAHLEEIVPTEAGSLATKEQIESVETMLSLTSEMVEGLRDKIDENTSSKSDVVAVEMLTLDVKKTVDDIKERLDSAATDEHRMTKADLDVLGIICTDIKAKITDFDLPVAAEMPSKADVEQLQGLLSDFRDSHDRLKESYESDIATTAKAFDDRKEEFDSTTRQIDDVRAALTDAKIELMERLNDSDSGLNYLSDSLRTLGEKTFSSSMSLEVSEILEIVKAEFEKTHTSVEALKVDHEHNAMTALEKQGEHKDAMVTEIGERLDTLFDGLMSKYDDAQLAAAESTRSLEEKTAAQDALFLSTKDMADDLKLSIDTLGTSLTTFTAAYPDTMDKMAEDSKLVFNRVDDAYNKLDETQLGLQHEHTVTRAEVQKVLTALNAVQNDMSEHNPRIMVSLKEVQALIAQHYDHSQKASQAAEQHAQAVRDLQQALQNGFEDAKGHNTSQTEALRGVLPAILPAPSDSTSSRAMYDDTAVHTKLDELMSHVRETRDQQTQFERLDEMHRKLMDTAAEVSTLVAQSKQMPARSSNDGEELALLLERRVMQRDQLEADIAVLDEEKESLQAEVDSLRAERDAMLEQKIKAATEVSSVETALQIRKEELHAMESKAEAIERRMLEGVLNQSRMLLLAKSSRPQPSPKHKPQGRDLRLASNTSSISTMTTSTLPPLQANHALALKTRPPHSRSSLPANNSSRRIMSLNQINHNVPNGASGYTAAPGLISSTAGSLQRSHSVKTGYMRKASWASGGKRRSLSSFNKENETLSEEDEDDDFQSVTNREDEDEDDFRSDAGTERRSSLAHEQGNDSKADYGGSELTFGTGSYLTGSDIDDRTSLGSVSHVEARSLDKVDEDQEEVQLGAEREGGELLRLQAPPQHKIVYAPPSDSGLGTDLPTAALSPSEHAGYFR